MKAMRCESFYAALEGPVVVGIEATGAMQWFLELLEELGIMCRVGHPAKIRAPRLDSVRKENLMSASTGTLVADSRPVVASTTYTQDAESMGREGKPLLDFNSK